MDYINTNLVGLDYSLKKFWFWINHPGFILSLERFPPICNYLTAVSVNISHCRQHNVLCICFTLATLSFAGITPLRKLGDFILTHCRAADV